MAPQKSPAFQFYPKDFMAGTATMSLQEVGAYMRLLCYAWDAGSVPNDPKERSRICACSRAQERELWKKVGAKFSLQNDVFLNERMEEERKKQAEYRRRQSDKGKASAAVRLQPEGNHGSTTVQPRPVEVRSQPEVNSSSSSSSSSLVTTKEQQPLRSAPLITNSLQFEKRRMQCAYVGARLEVPHALHGELRKLLGGLNAETDLLAWYADLDAEIEASGEPITPDVFRWLKAKFAAWAEQTNDSPAAIVARIEAKQAARKVGVS